MTTNDRLDALLADWPAAARTDAEWDERAQNTLAAATARGAAASGLSDDALFAPPLARLPEEGHSSNILVTKTQSSATSTGRLPQGIVVEKKMANPPDRSRDRTSLQDLAKLAGSPSMTPPPAAVASSASRPEEAGKDDSGIVDLKAMAAADPTAEQRAQSTPLADAGLFDDDAKAAPAPPAVAAALAPAVAPVAAANDAPPPSATLPSHPEPVAAVAAPAPAAKKDEEKKGGVLIILGGLAAVAAVAAGVFFMTRHKDAPAPVAAVATTTSPAAATVNANAAKPTADPEPAASVAIADTAAPTDDNSPDKKSMPKFTGSKPTPGTKSGGADDTATAAPSSSVDPKLVFNMPQTTSGTGGDLDEEMRRRVGGSKDKGGGGLTPASTAQGNVPQKPSQGQVAGAINVVLPEARACLSADDPVSKATVVFQSDGSVQSITVSGFAAGKSSEGCVKTALHKAKVPAFAEPSYAFPVTIRGTN